MPKRWPEPTTKQGTIQRAWYSLRQYSSTKEADRCWTAQQRCRRQKVSCIHTCWSTAVGRPTRMDTIQHATHTALTELLLTSAASSCPQLCICLLSLYLIIHIKIILPSSSCNTRLFPILLHSAASRCTKPFPYSHLLY